MVSPGSIVVLISGIVTALVGGFPLLGPVQNGPAWIFVSLLLFAASLALVPTVFLPAWTDLRRGAGERDGSRRGHARPEGRVRGPCRRSLALGRARRLRAHLRAHGAEALLTLDFI